MLDEEKQAYETLLKIKDNEIANLMRIIKLLTEDHIDLSGDKPPCVYVCDPNKNTNCEKTGCFINGGDCFLTTEKRYSIEVEK